MKPLAAIHQSQPRATVDTLNGARIVRSVCRECDKPLQLACQDSQGNPFEPDTFALQWADMLICTACAELQAARQAEENAHRALLDRVKDSGIQKSFKTLRFDDMDKSGNRGRAVAAAWAWADTPPRTAAGVLLHGVAGTGKTRLAGTAVWRRLQQYPVTWCSVVHLIAQLQTSFSDGDRQQAVRKLMGTGALVLDDLDKVKPSEWVLSQLFVAIDRRVAAGAPLFVTTNEVPARLAERFGSPLTSRLLGYCRTFELGGSDRRLDKKGERI